MSRLPSQLPLILLVAVTLGILIHVIYVLIPAKHAAFFYLLVICALFCLTGGLIPTVVWPRGLQRVAAACPIPLWQKALATMLFGGGA